MRLIDADREIERYTRDFLCPTPDVHEFEKRNAIIIVNALKQMKTVERRPKGKWIIKRGCEEVIAICSNCGAKDYIPTTIDGSFYFNRNYCWDCGADMRGEKE